MLYPDERATWDERARIDAQASNRESSSPVLRYGVGKNVLWGQSDVETPLKESVAAQIIKDFTGREEVVSKVFSANTGMGRRSGRAVYVCVLVGQSLCKCSRRYLCVCVLCIVAVARRIHFRC
jgi:hypothetical protein